MLEQLGLIGTILDEDQSPAEPDTESDQEVSQSIHAAGAPSRLLRSREVNRISAGEKSRYIAVSSGSF